MKLPGAFLLVALGLASTSALCAADPAKVDYTERNASYASAASISPATRSPEVNDSLQGRRISPPAVTYSTSPAASRPAALVVTETSAKPLVAPDVSRPDARKPELSAFDHRESRFQPDAAHQAPNLVARYQTALTAARAPAVSSSPASAAGTTSRVNRFVFHRNTATLVGATSAASPAGGATPVRVTP